MKSDITFMDCWRFIAPLIPVNTDYTMDIYIMVFNALKEAEKKRIAEKILRRMFAKYAYGNVPEWFASAVSATSYVLSVDKGKGIECISVLHTATERAPAEIRMTAQTKLLMICQETGMLGGIGSLPVL